MQFLLIARDGDDDGALARRMAAREQHLALADQLKASGNMLFGGAILNEAGQMAGSAIILDFPSRDDLDAWLKNDPYVLGDVWREIDIQPFRAAPSFLGPHR